MRLKLKVVGLLFGLICIFLWSCSENQANEETAGRRWKLEVIDTINLNIDTLTGYNYVFRLAEIEDKEYLVTTLGRANKIIYYSLNENYGKPVKTIQLLRSGPNAVQMMFISLTQSWDSIFVLSDGEKKIFCIDSAGRKLETYNAGTDDMFGIHANAENIPLFKKGDFIYYYKTPNFYMDEKEFVMDDTVRLRLNKKTGTIKRSVLHWPKLYTENYTFYGGYAYLASVQFLSSGLAVASFNLTPDLFVYNDSSLLATYSLKSKYVPTIPKTPSFTELNPKEERAYQAQIACYKLLYYDKYQEMLYRIVLHASNLYDGAGNMVKEFNKPFSIQIIDAKTFELKGEQDFPGNTYDIQNIIPTKRGILISTCNENNPDLQEDRLQFELFKLIPIKENEK